MVYATQFASVHLELCQACIHRFSADRRHREAQPSHAFGRERSRAGSALASGLMSPTIHSLPSLNVILADVTRSTALIQPRAINDCTVCGLGQSNCR